MILSDLPSPAEAGFAKAGNRFPLFGIMRSALHQVDVFNRDRTAIAEIDHENGKPDRRFRGRDREHQERENLADDVAHMGGEGDQIDVDREQDQLDRHQDDDHVLAVEKDAENPEREQDGGDREIMSEPDGHVLLPRPWPLRTPLRMSIASLGSRMTCVGMSWRLTRSLWRRVSTMAPIMATS